MFKIRLETFIVVFFFIALVFAFVYPVGDVDFPWHLKTGEYIYQHGEIPQTDPFSTASTGSKIEYFSLSQYWLAQVIFYVIYSHFGLIGIVVFRSILFTGIMAILWAMMNAPALVKTFALSLVVIMFAGYAGERPQLFSFLLEPVVLVILGNYLRSKSLNWLLILPLAMLFWANLHGGFILGDIIIMIVCACETVKYFFIRRPSPPLEGNKLLWLLAIGFMAIIVSYVNPNSSYALTIAVEGVFSSASQNIREYISPLTETWGPFVNRIDFVYWALIGYCLIILTLNLRRLNITHLGLVFFTLYISLQAVRFVPFFIMTGLIVSGQYRIGLSISDKDSILGRLRTLVNVLLLVAVVFLSGYLIYYVPGKERLSIMKESRYYPVRAARFLEEEVPASRMFNSHNLGAYLLYRLYPKFKVFTDTRGYNVQAMADSGDLSVARRWPGDVVSAFDTVNELIAEDLGRIEVSGARPADLPEKPLWRVLLRIHDIEVIVHEASNCFTGELYVLPLALIRDEEWKLVYSDGRALIFVKDIPKFRDIIDRYELPKEQVYDEIGMENATRVGSFHSEVYSSLAFALLMKGGSEEAAEKFIRHALDLKPRNVFASYLEALLQLKRRKV